MFLNDVVVLILIVLVMLYSFHGIFFKETGFLLSSKRLSLIVFGIAVISFFISLSLVYSNTQDMIADLSANKVQSKNELIQNHIDEKSISIAQEAIRQKMEKDKK